MPEIIHIILGYALPSFNLSSVTMILLLMSRDITAALWLYSCS